MQVRGLLAGLLALAVLGGLVWWSNRTETEKAAAPASAAAKLFTLKDEEVKRIEIARKGAEKPTVVERAKDGWQVASPEPVRADSDTVTSLVSAFTGLTEDRVIEEKAANLNDFGLADPQTKLIVNGKHTLLLGDDTPTGGGVYARLDGSPKVFTVASHQKSSLDKDWKDLRDKRLLTADQDKLSRVELTAKGSAVELGRNAQKEWQIVRPRPLRADNGAVEELVNKLRDAKMDTSEDAAEAAKKFATGTRIATASVTDSSGTQTLEVRKSGDAHYARSSALAGFYKVDNALAEGLNKSLDDLRNKKLFDFGFNEPSKIVMRDGTKQFHFVKGGERWWSNGKHMDSASVQSLIDKLRDLSAASFAAGTPGALEIEIAVTSDDGKRTEKVMIGSAGLAQREGEPAVYKLEQKAVDEVRSAAADVKAPPPAPPAPASK